MLTELPQLSGSTRPNCHSKSNEDQGVCAGLIGSTVRGCDQRPKTTQGGRSSWIRPVGEARSGGHS